MKKNAVICAIEYALKDEGCNEIPVAMLFDRVRKTRGNLDLSMQDFMIVLRELEKDGLSGWFGDTPSLMEDSLIARSQQHPSVPLGDAIRL
jgi:hypothetical protein